MGLLPSDPSPTLLEFGEKQVREKERSAHLPLGGRGETREGCDTKVKGFFQDWVQMINLEMPNHTAIPGSNRRCPSHGAAQIHSCDEQLWCASLKLPKKKKLQGIVTAPKSVPNLSVFYVLVRAPLRTLRRSCGTAIIWPLTRCALTRHR